MKRILSLSLAALLLAALCMGCALPRAESSPGASAPGSSVPPQSDASASKPADAYSEEGTPLFDFLGPEMQAFARNFERETPVAVAYRFDGVAGGSYSYVFDEAFINGLFDAARNLRVRGDTGRYTTDNTAFYVFLMADGTRYGFALNDGNLEHDGNIYETVNQFRLRDFRFPGYQDDSIFSIYPDRAVSAFGDAFYDLSVVSVSCQTGDDEPVKLTNTDAVEDAFLYFSLARPYPTGEYPAGGPDGQSAAPERRIIFTLADGTAFPFRFLGRNLAVDFPDPVGVQYYWLGDEVDDLFALF